MIISKEQVESQVKEAKRQANSMTPILAIVPIMFIGANVILYFALKIQLFSIIFGVMSGIVILAIVGAVGGKQNKDIADAGHFERTINEYFNVTKQMVLPEARYEFEGNSSLGAPQFMWFTPDSITFFPKPPGTHNHYLYDKIEEFQIPYKTIKYYYTSGDKYYENKISGGGSTGPNIGGAIIGEQIAGVGGAIVMGQSQTNPITSELVVHDERRTVILFQNAGHQFVKCLIPFDLYEVLYQHIPNLCRDVVEGTEKAKMIHQNVGGQTGADSLELKLKKLLELKNSGLIDESDYQAQKEKLLSQI